jgi:hypothetical protein
MTRDEMVKEFVCPGCVLGPNAMEGCPQYKPGEYNIGCTSHVLGTLLLPLGNIALGLPKGFNRPGYCQLEKRTHNQMEIRVWPTDALPSGHFNWLNLPTWALYKDGCTFVRTYSPRTNRSIVDVIEGHIPERAFADGVKIGYNVTDRIEEYD